MELENLVIPQLTITSLRARGAGLVMPLTCAVWVCVKYYTADWRRPDLHGFFETIADLLEAGGVIRDDEQVLSWDRSRLLLPVPGGPKTMLEIREYHPEEGEVHCTPTARRTSKSRASRRSGPAAAATPRAGSRTTGTKSASIATESGSPGDGLPKT